MTAVFRVAKRRHFTDGSSDPWSDGHVRSAWGWVGGRRPGEWSHAGSEDTDPCPVWTQEHPRGRYCQRVSTQAGVPFPHAIQVRRGSARQPRCRGGIAESRLWLVSPSAATVTLTRSSQRRSRPSSSRSTLRSDQGAERPIAFPLWIVNGSDPETMSVADWVWAGRSTELTPPPPPQGCREP